MTRAAVEAVLRTVRMVEQVPGLFTPDRKLPACPVCDETELWAHPGSPNRKNVFNCYACDFEFACPNPTGPTIAAAAIHHDGGTYWLAPPARHPHVMQAFGETRLANGTVKWRLFDGDQGFVDDAGNFLTREEAYAIAKAAGQLIPRANGYRKGEINPGPELFSEDLW